MCAAVSMAILTTRSTLQGQSVAATPRHSEIGPWAIWGSKDYSWEVGLWPPIARHLAVSRASRHLEVPPAKAGRQSSASPWRPPRDRSHPVRARADDERVW